MSHQIMRSESASGAKHKFVRIRNHPTEERSETPMKFLLAFAVALTGLPELASALPNPASVYCQKSGGKTEIRRNADGSSYGVCRLPDGRVVDEWAYFREHHRQSR